MKKERINLSYKELTKNAGQIAWLPANPRTWTADDIRRTVDSVTEDPDFLEDRPLLVVVDVPGNYVVFAGNLRCEAVARLKMRSVPCVLYTPEGPEDELAIVRRAMKDNGSFGSWDYDALSNEWGDLPLQEWGVPVWETEKAEDGGAGSSGAPNVTEDDFEENDAEIHVRCKPGDIWELGDHRLKCGDSTDLETVKSLMGGALADMVFTDPPYGVAIGDKNAILNSVQKAGCCCKNIENDTLPVEDLYQVLRRAFENAKSVSADDACYFVCSPPGGEFGLMMMMMMQDAGLKVRHQIVWNKNSATFSLGRLDYDYKHEAILYTWTKSHHNYRGGAFRTSVWDIPKPRKCDLHPTMKPVELVANCLLDGTKEGDTVLDIFGGSGTTLVACEQLGRKCRIVEIDPHYCDVIIARWEALTGKTAQLSTATGKAPETEN